MATILDDVALGCDNIYTHMISGQRFAVISSLKLESGIWITAFPIAFKTWGRLNEARNNVLVVCHALTGSADASDWWSPLFGPDKALDPTRFFVICFNIMGSPYGSASSLTVDPTTGKPYGPSFPQTTVRDDVRANKLVLDALGVHGVTAVVGGSMGGMAALEWALCTEPGYIHALIPIATAPNHSAWGISWAEAQRQCILLDSRYEGGLYNPVPEGQPVGGLSAARTVAMLTYRSGLSFEQRFARGLHVSKGRDLANASPPPPVDSPQNSSPPPVVFQDRPPFDSNPVFAAQSYLKHQGDKFIRRFDANCYLHLLTKLDSHDVTLGRTSLLRDSDEDEVLTSVLSKAPTGALVLGVASDGLFLPAEQTRLAKSLPDASLHLLQSTDGHDGFLLEFDEMNREIVQYLKKKCAWAFEGEPYLAALDAMADDKADDGVGEQW